jgi:hypothetical protein
MTGPVHAGVRMPHPAVQAHSSGNGGFDVALPLVLLLGIVVLLLHRAREVRVFHLLVIGLFGFFLGSTFFAGPIRSVLGWLLHTNS